MHSPSATSLDFALFQLVSGLADQHHVLDVLMIWTAEFSPVILALVLAGLWLTWRPRAQRYALLAAISALIALGLGQVIGFAFPRDRPYLLHHVKLLVTHAPDTSFPSDHTTLAFAIAVVVWQLNRRLGAWLLFFGILIGFARVFIGVHYPADVLGGAVVGTIVSLVVAVLSRKRPVDSALDRAFLPLARWHLAALPNGRERTPRNEP